MSVRPLGSCVRIGLLGASLWASPAIRAANPVAEAPLESMSLEDLMGIPVYAASRHEQKSSEAPSAVTVITSAEIRKYGWRTLGDLLRTVRGFQVTYDRAYQAIGVRGFQATGDLSTKVLFLVDGHRLNDDVYNQGYIGEDFLLDLDLVDRVEIVRGPSSSLYGSNAFFAVISVITRRGGEWNGIEVSAEAEEPPGFRARVTYGKRYGNGTEILLSASALEREGEDLFFPELDDPATNDGHADGLDGVGSRRFFASVSRRSFTFTAGFVRRDKELPTASYGSVFPDPDAWNRDDWYFADGRYEKERGGTSLTARVFLDWYRYGSKQSNEDPDVNPVPPFGFVLRDQADASSWGVETKVTRKLLERHTATAGIEYRGIYRIKQIDFVENPFTSYLDGNRKGYVGAVYLQDEIQMRPGLLLNVGVRHDRYDTFGGTTNPRAALIWAPKPRTALKLLYGQAFRAPAPFELYWNDGGNTQKENTGLAPETIRTLEAVWEQGHGSNLHWVVAAYQYRIRDLITLTTDPVDGLDVSRNLGRARASGIEAELSSKTEGGFEGRIAGSLQRAQDESTGDRLPNSAPYIIQANLTAPLWGEKAFAAIEGQLIGRRQPVAPIHSTPAGAYAVFNLTIGARKLIRGLSVSASVYNLLDRPYADLGGPEHVQELIPQDGRSFRLKVTASF